MTSQSDIRQIHKNDMATERAIRAASDRFGKLFLASGRWFDDHPDFAPDPVSPGPRKGIMAGRDPRTDAMIAARVAMSERSRMAVTIGNMRGMI